MISFQVEGVNLAIAKFAELEVATEAAAKVGTEHAAENVLKMAKTIVPVDTGRLRDSLHIKQDSEGAELVGTDVEYAVFVEFGGANPAEPFLRPAADEANFSVAVEQALSLAIRAVAGL